MKMCADIQADAAGLASLSQDAPERREAFSHARTCAACAAALAEGEALMQTLGEGAALPAPSPEVLARVSQLILADLGRSPAQHRQSTATIRAKAIVSLLASVVAAWFVPLAAGRKLGGDAPLTTSVLLAAVAASTTAVALLLGGPALVAPALASLVAALLGGGDGNLQTDIGQHCLTFEVGMAIVPMSLAFALAWRQGLARRLPVVAAAAAGGALAAQAALLVTCHAVPSYAHLIVCHTGGLVIAMALGALASRFVPAGPAPQR